MVYYISSWGIYRVFSYLCSSLSNHKYKFCQPSDVWFSIIYLTSSLSTTLTHSSITTLHCRCHFFTFFRWFFHATYAVVMMAFSASIWPEISWFYARTNPFVPLHRPYHYYQPHHCTSVPTYYCSFGAISPYYRSHLPCHFPIPAFFSLSEHEYSIYSIPSKRLLTLGTIGLLYVMIDVSILVICTQFRLFMHILNTGDYLNTSTHFVSVRWYHPHTDSNPIDK